MSDALFFPPLTRLCVPLRTVWRKQRSGLQYWGASWTQKGVYRAHCPHPQFMKGDYSLLISRVVPEDGGVYFCSVEHLGLTTTVTVTLRVMAVSIFPSVPIPGGKVSVTCDVTPWPVGASVQWMLNNQSYSPPSVSTSNKNTMVMQQVAMKLTGTWTCVLGYKGREGRVSADLSVKGIIHPPTDDTRVYAAVGSAVHLPCVFSPGFTPSSSLWEKLQPASFFSKLTPDRLPPSFFTPPPSDQSPLDKSAGLKEVDFQDGGRYRCSGTIQGQSLTRVMKLVVAKSEWSCQHSATLTCQLSDDSEVTGYEWLQVTSEVNGSQTVRSVHQGETLSISLLSEDTWTTWVCLFSKKDGILGNVTYQVQMTSSLTGQRSTGLSQNTVAVVGLSVLLLVLLLVLAQTYKNVQRRKRILQYPALEGIVHSISNEREKRERTRVKE
uniref:Lymphocyte activating 3 n=1 Tax=Cynoglossus semilaevis TaxID=244447 RepID=A0A3P8WXB8_CYNSE